MAKPTELQEQTQKALVRSDLNLEKWPLWQPADSRTAPRTRLIEREITLPDGSRTNARVEVGYSHLGVLNTEDQKILYALLKLWEENGWPAEITFSRRGLAKVLRKMWGSKIARSITQSLLRLRGNLIVWTNSYEDKRSGETIRLLKTFTILSELEIHEKDAHGHTTKQECRCRFHPLVEFNIRANHSKPVVYDTIIGFQSGVAQLIYRHVDLMLFERTYYIRRTRELFVDIGLEGDIYKRLSRRRETLERAFRELQGVPLSTGILTARLEPSKDGQDLNAIFGKRSPTAASSEFATAEWGLEAPQPLQPEARGAQDASLWAQEARERAVELVQYFYALFYDLGQYTPNMKELGQAVSLISRIGYDGARRVVEFAFDAAPKSNYRPQVFGGVLHYSGRAMADLAWRQAWADANDSTVAPPCTLCNSTGRISLRDSIGTILEVGCPHNEDKVRDWEKTRRLVRVQGSSKDTGGEPE